MNKTKIFGGLLFSIILISATFNKQQVVAQQTVICPSGDRYICLDSHGELGTVYRGKGKVIVQ